MTRLIAALLTLMMYLFTPTGVQAKKVVINVGVTSVLPPFIIDRYGRRGLVFDVVEALNQSQQDYYFSLAFYPPKRIREIYQDSHIHLVAFTDVKWGWTERGGEASMPLINSRDLFVSLKSGARNSNIDTIGAVRGFHYKFARFDPDYLATMKEVTIVNTEEDVLQLVVRGRVHRGIVSESMLNWFSVNQPEIYNKLSVDWDNPDSKHQRQFVILPASPLSTSQVNSLFRELYRKGELQAMYDRYGLKLPENKEFLGL